MTAANWALPDAPRFARPWRLFALTLVGALAAVAWIERPSPDGIISVAALPVPPPMASAGPFIDHSVLNDPDLLPEPDPSPLSVAAYGD